MRTATILVLLLFAPLAMAEPSHQISEVKGPSSVTDNGVIFVRFLLLNLTNEAHPLYNNSAKIPISISFNGSNPLDISGITVEALDVYNHSTSVLRVNNSLVFWYRLPAAPPSENETLTLISQGWRDSYRYDYKLNQSDFTAGNVSYVRAKISNYSDYWRTLAVRITPGNARIPAGRLGIIIDADTRNDSDKRFPHSTGSISIEIRGNGAAAPSTTVVNSKLTGVFSPLLLGGAWNSTIISSDREMGLRLLSGLLFNGSSVPDNYGNTVVGSANIGATKQVFVGVCGSQIEPLLGTSCANFFVNNTGFVNLYNTGPESVLVITAKDATLLNRTVNLMLSRGFSINELPEIVTSNDYTQGRPNARNGTDSDLDGVTDDQDPDDDDDNVADWNDPLLGALRYPTMPVLLDSKDQAGINRSGSKKLMIRLESKPLVEMDFDSSSKQINLSAITITLNATGRGGISVNGLEGRKIIHLKRVNSTFDGVCVKDANADVSVISANCDAWDERRILCDGILNNGLRCYYNATIDMLRVEGIMHSAIRQQQINAPAVNPPTPSTPIGGNVCTSNWKCSEWSACQTNGTRVRTCIDTNYCYKTGTEPTTQEGCTYADATSTTDAAQEPAKPTKIDYSGIPDAIPEDTIKDVATGNENKWSWNTRDYYIFFGLIIFISVAWMVMYMLFS